MFQRVHVCPSMPLPLSLVSLDPIRARVKEICLMRLVESYRVLLLSREFRASHLHHHWKGSWPFNEAASNCAFFPLPCSFMRVRPLDPVSASMSIRTTSHDPFHSVQCNNKTPISMAFPHQSISISIPLPLPMIEALWVLHRHQKSISAPRGSFLPFFASLHSFSPILHSHAPGKL